MEVILVLVFALLLATSSTQNQFNPYNIAIEKKHINP